MKDILATCQADTKRASLLTTAATLRIEKTRLEYDLLIRKSVDEIRECLAVLRKADDSLL